MYYLKIFVILGLLMSSCIKKDVTDVTKEEVGYEIASIPGVTTEYTDKQGGVITIYKAKLPTGVKILSCEHQLPLDCSGCGPTAVYPIIVYDSSAYGLNNLTGKLIKLTPDQFRAIIPDDHFTNKNSVGYDTVYYNHTEDRFIRSVAGGVDIEWPWTEAVILYSNLPEPDICYK